MFRSSSSSSSTIEFDVDNNGGAEDRVGGNRTLNLGLLTSESEEGLYFLTHKPSGYFVSSHQ